MRWSSAVALAVLVACTSSGVVDVPQPLSTPRLSPVACPTVTRLSHDPFEQGLPPDALRLGPLWLRTTFAVRTGVARIRRAAGTLTKVVIEHRRGSGTVSVTGSDCATGSQLRFCFSPCQPPQPLVMQDVPATTAVSIDVSNRYTDVGNLLFTSAGPYRLQVVDAAGRALGMAVVVALS